jgi:predicted N-formylglutamate amidohydrolase
MGSLDHALLSTVVSHTASSADDLAPGLLTPEDPPPYRVLNPEGSASILLVCDHAANTVPQRLGSLGLPPTELGRHIGWDIGAEAVTRRLAELLGAQAILTSFSRLVVDCNRALDDPTAMPEQSDGTVVPANASLDPEDRGARTETIYWPYHRMIATVLDRFAARGVAPAVLAIHSFTPRMNGFDRPWQIGVLWDQDPRIPVPLIHNLSQGTALTVGDNEPYSARGPTDFTLPYHAVSRGLPHALLEIRQDEIATAEGAARYADLIGLALESILADPALFRAAAPSRLGR